MTGTTKILLGILLAGVTGLLAWKTFGHGHDEGKKSYKALGQWSSSGTVDHGKYTDSKNRVWYLTGVPGKVLLGGEPGSAYVEADLEVDLKKAQKPGSVTYVMLWDGTKYPHSDKEWDDMWIVSFHGYDSNDYEFLGQTMDEIAGDYQSQREPSEEVHA